MILNMKNYNYQSKILIKPKIDPYQMLTQNKLYASCLPYFNWYKFCLIKIKLLLLLVYSNVICHVKNMIYQLYVSYPFKKKLYISFFSN